MWKGKTLSEFTSIFLTKNHERGLKTISMKVFSDKAPYSSLPCRRSLP